MFFGLQSPLNDLFLDFSIFEVKKKTMSIIRRSESINVLLKQYRLRKFMQQILVQSYHGRSLIGKRDVVGYGFNGSYTYYDTTDMPYPAIRFREETEEITRLREKEKNDWKQLTLEEKKKRK